MFFVKKSNLETSQTIEEVLKRREVLEDVCPIGNAHLTMVLIKSGFNFLAFCCCLVTSES